jgi:hypothetical protein
MGKAKAKAQEASEPQVEAKVEAPVAESATEPEPEPESKSKAFKKTASKTFSDYPDARVEYDARLKEFGKEGPKNKTKVRIRRRPVGHGRRSDSTFEVVTYVRP